MSMTHRQRGREGCPGPFNIHNRDAFLRDERQNTGLLLSHRGSPRQHLYTTGSTDSNTQLVGGVSTCHTPTTQLMVCVDQSEGIGGPAACVHVAPGNPPSVQASYPVQKECAQNGAVLSLNTCGRAFFFYFSFFIFKSFLKL